MTVKFKYKLSGAGWANSNISIDGKSISMKVSYLSDALGDLTKAIVRLFEGTNKVEVFFMDEPGEHRISLVEKSKDILGLKIDWFDDWLSWDFAEEKEGRTVLEAEISLKEFAGEVERELDLILNEYGLDGYHKKWIEHKFPYQDYKKLKEYNKKYDRN